LFFISSILFFDTKTKTDSNGYHQETQKNIYETNINNELITEEMSIFFAEK
jgi:hypothetical protein